MAGQYGWSYSRELQTRKKATKPRMNRFHRRSVVTPAKTLHWQMPKKSQTPIPWERLGKLAIAGLLVLISLAVLSKGQELKLEAGDWLSQNFRQWTVGRSSRPQLAVAVPRVENKPLLLETEAINKGKIWALVVDKALFALDQNGQVWSLRDDKLPGDLPVITGLVVREEPGELGFKLTAAMDWPLIQRLLKMPCLDQLSEIHFGSREGVLIFMRDGIKILLRNSPHLERDLVRMEAVLNDIRVKQKLIARVDLRYDQHVVVRPKLRR